MRAAADTNLQLPMYTQCSDNFSFAVENIGDSFAAALRRRQNRLSFLQRQIFAAAKERTRDFDVTGHFCCCKFVLGFAAAKKERQFCRCNVDFVSALLPLFFFLCFVVVVFAAQKCTVDVEMRACTCKFMFAAANVYYAATEPCSCNFRIVAATTNDTGLSCFCHCHSCLHHSLSLIHI